MVIDRRSSLIDVAFTVCTALDAVGTRAVLSGGSAATYYAPSAYQSRDCDFIITLGAGGAEASRAIAELGYTEKGGIYSHPRNPFTVEFPPGPLTVGGESVSSYETVYRGEQHLYVLSRTDCVRDRLAAYYHWDDRSSLSTAIAVASSGPVDWSVIEAWSAREATPAKLEDVLRERDAAIASDLHVDAYDLDVEIE